MPLFHSQRRDSASFLFFVFKMEPETNGEAASASPPELFCLRAELRCHKEDVSFEGEREERGRERRKERKDRGNGRSSMEKRFLISSFSTPSFS